MEIIPENLKTLIEKNDELLRKYYEEQLVEGILRQNEEHLLVKLKEMMDFKGIEQACEGYHHQSGPGSHPRHTVEKMVRVLLVKALYDLSYRKVERILKTDLVVRWFAGYGLSEQTPDHSTVERFEIWVQRKRRRVYFDSVLEQIYATYPDEQKAVQMGDTYAMEAKAARQSVEGVWRQLSKRVLEAGVREVEAFGRVVSGLDWVGLFGEPKEKRPRNDEKRAERRKRNALAVQELVERVRKVLSEQPKGEMEALRQAVEYLEKALTDEVEIDGEQVREKGKGEKGAYRMGSGVDPEASFRNHGERDGEMDIRLGYNTQVAATENGLITETEAYTGATSDQQTVAGLVEKQKEHHGVVPPKLIYDKAGGTGKVRHEVSEASEGKTMVSAPLPDYAKRSERFGPYDFELSADGKRLTCPQGKSTDIAYRSGSGDGRMFRFYAGQCWEGKPPARWKGADLSKRCPLWEQCRGKKSGPRQMRQVFVSDYRKEVEAAQAYNKTETYEEDRKKRGQIERVIAELVRYNGARRCRGVGLAAADWQAKMAATAYNLKWWVRRMEREKVLSPPGPGVESAC